MGSIEYDVVILGAGAAGLMCGAVAGKRGLKVLIVDHASKPGEKIRISGGGRCNFTNIHSGPANFISQNKHFCKSALAGYTPQDFISLVESYGITWYEKTKGQLFCHERSQQIIDMLLSECKKAKTKVQLSTDIKSVDKSSANFTVDTNKGPLHCRSVVVATGGPSIPKMGATGFAYKCAAQFGLNVIEPRPGLVPLTFTDSLKDALKVLAGVSTDAVVRHEKTTFDEALLFTHRGLSGPSILQISSYWREGDEIEVNLAPATDVKAAVILGKKNNPRQHVTTLLSSLLPRRLAEYFTKDVTEARLADMSDKTLGAIADRVQKWVVKPAGSEGMRTAEVTLGGIDTKELSSKTLEVTSVPGLHFIGEAVDVTGHLGGHNFQWAWASGVACGNNILRA